MKKPILLALRCCALFYFLFSFTCYSQNSKSSTSKQNSGKSNKIQQLPDIYVAGECYNPTTQRGTAVYWKNGEPVALTDGQIDASALSIAVVGDDVYVLGIMGGRQAVYWKNGQATSLRADEYVIVPQSMVVINGDVYVAGYCRAVSSQSSIKDFAMYWKNGQPVKLPVSMDEHTSAQYIAAVSDDIYILGSNETKSLYWKNGQKVETINELKKVSAIAQLQGNVYAVGATESGQAAYWKNGHTESLSINGLATCIAVSGNDVYVAGIHDVDGYGRIDTDDKGKYWKNGQLLGDLNGTDYFIYRPESIAVSGNDVYIVGRAQIVSNGGYRMGFLKNGQTMDLKVIEGCSASIANFVTSNGGSGGELIKQNNEGSKSKTSKQNLVNPDNHNVALPQNKQSEKVSIAAENNLSIEDNTKKSVENNVALSFEEQQAKDFFDENRDKPGIVSLPNGLQYEVMKMGTGPKPSVGDQVDISGTRTTMIGKRIIGGSAKWEGSATINEKLMAGQAQALLMMNEGSRYKLFIPSNLVKPIRSYAGLIYIIEIELLKILK